tara:strand:+ start:98 stop:316 length:219 start_codon:yes stop_codon:yes gene_type:complete
LNTRGLLKRYQFCMAQGIAVILTTVSSMADGVTLPIQHHSSHGNFSIPACFRSAHQQNLHPALESDLLSHLN